MGKHPFGGYAPLRRAYRRIRPARASLLTPAGRAIWRYTEQNGLVVRRGPFAGLEYPASARGHAGFLAAKILGSYELELHEVIERAVTNGFKHVVDIGSGEGYYVVGLARRMGDDVRITGFETDPGDRALCSEMAELNDVRDRIELLGECDPERLRKTLRGNALVVCDCEGYELELLRLDVVPQLQSATVLVELHSFVENEIEAIIEARFSATHEITIYRQRQRNPWEFEELRNWPGRAAYLVISEGWLSDEQWLDSGRFWAFMSPRQPSSVDP